MSSRQVPTSFLRADLTSPRAGYRRSVCRLGLASRGERSLTADDVYLALDRGVNFLNWCGAEDGLSAAVAGLGARRSEVVLCVQLEARTADEARRELDGMCEVLATDFLDVVTFYYVEEHAEWRQIVGPGGALEGCAAARDAGQIGLVGVTSHQRPWLAEMAHSGLLDLLMLRYNAAHRGAETEVLPAATALGLPVVAYTCLRWGALLHGTPADRAELEEDLTVLEASGPLTAAVYEALAAHGRRVRQHAGRFP